MANSDDLVERIERLKTAALEVATTNRGDHDDDEYKATRKLIQGHPQLGKHVPDWLRRSANLWEVRQEVSRLAGDDSGKWQRRREIVAEDLNPLLDLLQGGEISADGHLEQVERIGGGGFGEVYRYHHKLIGVDFAVKVLDPAFAAEGEKSLDRFVREARILFQLNHSSIVRIYDVGLMGHRPFIRMELVDGVTLNDRLSREGSFAEDAANYAARRLASALTHAHAKGIVHRDIKPSNIMVAPDDRIVLLDFGLGVFIEGDIVSRITKTGEAAVGGLYTAPELVADPTLLDPRTDIYSLGAVWYTLLCGQPPAGSNVKKVLSAVSPSAPVLALVLRCLAPLEDRPAADELAAEIKALD